MINPTGLQLYTMILGRDVLMAKILALIAGEPLAELWTETANKLDEDILHKGLVDNLGGKEDD